MKTMNRLIYIILIATCFVASTTARAQEQDKKPDPIIVEMTALAKQWETLVPDTSALNDPAAREAVREQGLELCEQFLVKLDEWKQNHRPMPFVISLSLGFLTNYIVLGGDPSDVPVSEGEAEVASNIAKFITGTHEDQQTLFNKCKEVLDKDPTDMKATLSLALMTKYAGLATPELKKQLAAYREDAMKRSGRTQQLAEAAERIKAFEGKPMALKGTLVDGIEFSTEQWKGKVILVDFWATWCAPCRAELPHLKEAYEKYHDKGLEIIGVSNDFNKQALEAFIKNNPDLPWPHFFDSGKAEQRGWHPLTKEFGINAIPALFLIDRNGVCNSVTARGHLDEMIPPLLEEVPADASASAKPVQVGQ